MHKHTSESFGMSRRDPISRSK